MGLRAQSRRSGAAADERGVRGRTTSSREGIACFGEGSLGRVEVPRGPPRSEIASRFAAGPVEGENPILASTRSGRSSSANSITTWVSQQCALERSTEGHRFTRAIERSEALGQHDAWCISEWPVRPVRRCTKAPKGALGSRTSRFRRRVDGTSREVPDLLGAHPSNAVRGLECSSRPRRVLRDGDREAELTEHRDVR